MAIKMFGGFFVFLLFLFIFSNNVIALAEEVLTWQDCVKEAAKNHPDLISAQEAVKESEASKKITASTIFPQIDASVTGSTAKTRTTTSGNSNSSTADTYKYGATATQLLFDGLKSVEDVKAAEQDLVAAKFNYKYTSSEVRLRLRTAFISLLKAQELSNITEEIYNIRRGNLELITLRYESGIEHKGALLNAEANLEQAKFEISQAKRALEVAQRGLIKETGRSQFSPVRAEGTFQVKDAIPEKPDFEALALLNPSLGKLIAQKNSAAFGIKSSRANFLPELTGSAAANRSSAHWFPEDDQWSAGLTLSVPLFEGGLKFAELSKAKALFNQAREDERSTKDGLILILQETWAALQDAVETTQVKNKFLEAAIERAKIAEAQYSLGLINFDAWTIIEDALVSAKKTLLAAQADALLAEANWVQAKGERLEYAD